MADVTTTFAAKDESFAKTVANLEKRLNGFQGTVSSFTGKVGAMAKSFKGMLGPLAAVGAAFLGARSAAQAFGDAINLGGQLNDLAARTGASAGELMVLRRAFQNAGAGADSVGPTVNRLQRAIVEAGQGVTTYTRAFDALNLNHAELAKMSPTEQLRAVAQAISRLPDATQRSAVAMQLLGRSGGELLPFLRNFGGEIDNATAQLGSAPRIMDEANEALDALGDNFEAIKSKGMEFALGILKSIAPALANITDIISKIDFAAIGERLGQAIQTAYDFMRGLFADPSKIFGVVLAYVDMIPRAIGDGLITAFTTAAKFFGNLFMELVRGDTFGKLAEVLADAFVFAANFLVLKMFEAVEKIMTFFGSLFNAVTEQGVSGLAKKLFNMVKAFGSDFVQILTNPLGFIAGKFGSALMDSTKESADAYKFAWNEATGNVIQRHKAGLTAATNQSADALAKSGAALGESISSAIGNAAGKTEVIKSNFFGSAEAMERVADKFSDIAQTGREMREAEQAQQAATEKGGKLGEAMQAAAGSPVNTAEIQKEYNEQAQKLRDMNLSTAEFNDRMKELNQWMYQALSGGGGQTQQGSPSQPVEATPAPAAMTEPAGRAEAEQQKAMGLANSAASKGASESTLQRVANLMEQLNTKLPQPVLV